MEVRDLPTYDGLSEVDTFLDKFEMEVTEKKRFHTLNDLTSELISQKNLYTAGPFGISPQCVD